MNKKIGISTGCMAGLGFTNEQAIKLIKKSGIQTTEVFIQARIEMTSARIYELRKVIRNSGVHVNSIHPFMEGYEVPNLFSEMEDKFYDGLEYFYRYLEISNLLGNKYLIMHGPLPTVGYEAAIRRLRLLIRMAADLSIGKEKCLNNH
ncbi:hypothetical protein BSQ38_10610 [Pediococcus damnosus]|uniref:sugar phosphate isomerase/epimerase family protein n=1 Tax=Pediococcus damnosus TaxID=51663 RepID=UPI000C1CB8DF|nr:TIM barrel protein [Pediococcus damnosus]PIO80064.1 hypothetical protein BSQ38_10610 [Pediococcus damnosus]